MALVSTGFAGNAVIIDNGANRRTVTFKLDQAVASTYALALALVQAAVAAYTAITDAVVVSYSAYEKFEENALSLPAGGVQVENTAVISAKTSDAPEKWATIRVLAPKAGVFVGSSGSAANVVDAGDADLVTYLTLYTAGDGLLISDGESILTPSAATIKGKRVHTSSTKG